MLRTLTLRTIRPLLLAVAAAGIHLTAAAHDVHDEAANLPTDRHVHAAPQYEPASEVRALTAAFRRTGDDTHLDAAWTIVEERLAAARHVDDLVDAAFVAQARHRFDVALALIDEALTIRPTLDQAWLLRSSILLVQGDSAGAAAACRELRDAALLVIAACHARAAASGKDASAAAQRLDALLRIEGPAIGDASIRAWALGVAADLDIATGRTDRAERRYRESLALAESVQVRAALSDVLIDAGRYAEATGVLEEGADALPLVVRSFVVATRIDNAQRFDKRIAFAHREFQDWIAAEDWLHAREMARFYVDVLDEPELARRLAAINLGLQCEREDIKLAVRTGVIPAERDVDCHGEWRDS